MGSGLPLLVLLFLVAQRGPTPTAAQTYGSRPLAEVLVAVNGRDIRDAGADEVRVFHHAGTAASWYSYGSPWAASANTAVGLETEETQIFAFVATAEGLFFANIFDRFNDAEGGTAKLSLWCHSGCDVATQAVQDDSAETASPCDASGTCAWTWAWAPCCTDGMMYGPLQGCFNISLELTQSTGITTSRFAMPTVPEANTLGAFNLTAPIAVNTSLGGRGPIVQIANLSCIRPWLFLPGNPAVTVPGGGGMSAAAVFFLVLFLLLLCAFVLWFLWPWIAGHKRPEELQGTTASGSAQADRRLSRPAVMEVGQLDDVQVDFSAAVPPAVPPRPSVVTQQPDATAADGGKKWDTVDAGSQYIWSRQGGTARPMPVTWGDKGAPASAAHLSVSAGPARPRATSSTDDLPAVATAAPAPVLAAAPAATYEYEVEEPGCSVRNCVHCFRRALAAVKAARPYR